MVISDVKSRGGFEDTRLEAKDTKKSEAKAKDSPSEDTLLRPRTGMLEAKAKNQGHKRKCSLKKKVFNKIFQAVPQKNGEEKNF